MRQTVGVGEYLVRVAEHPLQKVSIVDALVHKRAAVVLPRAAPFSGVKVRLVAVAANLRRAVQKTAEAAIRDFRVQRAHRRAESELMVHTELHAVFRGRFDHRVGVLERERDRLFHDHVRPGFETIADDLPLDAAAESDRRESGALLGEHGAVVGVELHAGALLLREQRERLFSVFLHEIAERDDLQPGLERGADMVGADHPAADESIFHSFVSRRISQIFSAAWPSPNGW